MHQNNDEQSHAYEEHANNEAMARGRAFERIRVAQRDRSRSNVGTSVHSSDSLASKDERSDSLSDAKDILSAYTNHAQGDHPFATGVGFDMSDDGNDAEFPSLLQREVSEMPEAADEIDQDFVEDEEDDDEALKEEENKDVRDELFEAIPEPYWQSIDFQRVLITEANEPQEEDTKEACRLLKKSMEIREKWISAHPFPPQDISEGFEEEVVAQQLSPPRKSVHKDTPMHHHLDGSIHTQPEFRRRSVPPYKIFGTQLPETIPDMKFKMVNGVMHVNYVTVRDDMDFLNGEDDIPTHAISEEKTAGLVRSNSSQELAVSESDSDNEDKKKSASAQTTTDNASATKSDIKRESSTGSSQTAQRRPSFKRSLSRIPSIFCTDDECLEVDWSHSLFPVFSFAEYVADFDAVRKSIYSGPCTSFAYKRLELLAARFNLHVLLNERREIEAQKSVPHRDFYNVRKVDTHVHHSACMNQKHMLRFIKYKLKHHPNEAVIFRDGRFLTLGEVFKSLNLTAYDLSIDTLDMHANNTFRRFDRFNLKYNPAGQSRLREIFLKTENILSGSFLAEITREVMQDLEASKYQLVEWRISIYGRKASEWSSLSRWFYVNRLAHQNVRWVIQTPRLYDAYKRSGEVQNFAQMLSNIFAPLFAVSIDPSSNPPMHYFLQTVVAFDSVDDESRPELEYMSSKSVPPEEWNLPNNPPYSYWMYYMYANICALNKLRASRGLSTFAFRPHCGEAGDIEHLVATYICAHEINHGIVLRKNASLHYLYYLSQIGIAMSPLSNNKLFLDYNKNPFPKYFCQGLNVSLSTDDPLMLHFTKDALLEEYSVAAQVWRLSATDQCEIARNSVLQSGWERKFKLHFLGKDCADIRETNVPLIRLIYREETLAHEKNYIMQHAMPAVNNNNNNNNNLANGNGNNKANTTNNVGTSIRATMSAAMTTPPVPPPPVLK